MSVSSIGDTQAVSGFNLTVEKGEFISLLGPSGCGKTTTLQMIAGFEADAAAASHWTAANHAMAPNTRGLGIVFQSYALFPHMTVEQNVGFGLKMRTCGGRARERVGERCRWCSSKPRSAYPRELSGGQRQRVALARALVIARRVLLLDEPLSEPRRQAAREMQFETARHPAQARHHHRHGHARPGRGAVDQRSRGGDGGRPHHPGGPPYRAYEHPASSFVSHLRRQGQPARRPGGDGAAGRAHPSPVPGCTRLARPASSTCRRCAAGDACLGLRPPREDPLVPRPARAAHGRPRDQPLLPRQPVAVPARQRGRRDCWPAANEGGEPLVQGAPVGTLALRGDCAWSRTARRMRS